jgi:Fe-Mn family superoxide dismutase
MPSNYRLRYNILKPDSMKQFLLLLPIIFGGFFANAQHEQIKLKYSYGDLEPFVDSTTMRIHYSAHHATYVKNLNKALEGHADLKNMPLIMLLKNINSLPQSIQMAVRNNGGGVYNHNLFFDVLTPASNSVMPNELQKILTAQFGSVDLFKAEMEKAASSRFGSGWAWLLVQPNGKLTVVSTANQDAPFMDVSFTEGHPIFNIDVWEHAYYLKYQNKRADYLKRLWNVVDWKQVYQNYLSATGE